MSIRPRRALFRVAAGAFVLVGASLVLFAAACPAKFGAFWNRLVVSCHKHPRELLTLRGNRDAVFKVAFDPSGKWIAGSTDRAVLIWDATDGRLLREIAVPGGEVFSVCYSNADGRLAAGCSDQVVYLWDTISDSAPQRLIGHSGDVWTVAFDRPGTRLVTCSSVFDNRKLKKTSGEVRLWNTDGSSPGGKPLVQDHQAAITCVAFSPTGSQIAAGTGDSDDGGEILLFSTEEVSSPRELRGHSAAVLGLTFNGDGSRLASCSWDKTVKVWDAATGEALLTFEGHDDVVHAVAFGLDNRLVASATWDLSVGQIKMWNADTGDELLDIKAHTGFIRGLAFSPDGTRLASCSNDGTVKVWDVRGLAGGR